MGKLPSSVLPLVSLTAGIESLTPSAPLLLSTGMSVLFFRERLTPSGILGIAVSFAGLLMIHFL